MTIFLDSDWAADTTNRRSHSRQEAVMLNGGAINWPSKQQNIVALLTTETEYVALNRATQSAIHFRKLLQDGHHHQSTKVDPLSYMKSTKVLPNSRITLWLRT
jgi:hypothetical protein